VALVGVLAEAEAAMSRARHRPPRTMRSVVFTGLRGERGGAGRVFFVGSVTPEEDERAEPGGGHGADRGEGDVAGTSARRRAWRRRAC